MVAADHGRRPDVELREPVMPPRATRAIGTGDGWDLTDGGIYLPGRTERQDMRPGGDHR